MPTDKGNRKFTFWEGWHNYIADLATDEERLAAYETITAIAFPKDENVPYMPPAQPTNGNPLSPADRVRRQVYHFTHGIIVTGSSINGKTGTVKDPVKVMCGKQGGRPRRRDFGDSTDESFPDNDFMPPEPTPLSLRTEPPAHLSPSDPSEDSIPQLSPSKPADMAEPPVDIGDTPSRVWNGHYYQRLTPQQQARIAQWNHDIPDAEALQKWIKRNLASANLSAYSNSMDLCEYAYNELAHTYQWVSSKSHRPFTSLAPTLAYLAQSFAQQQQRQELSKRKLNALEQQSALEIGELTAQNKSSSDIAALERKRRRQAERAAAAREMQKEG